MHALNTQKVGTSVQPATPRKLAVRATAPLWLAGCSLVPWARLLLRHRRGIKLKCLPAMAIAAVLSAISTGLGLLQDLFYHRRISRTPIPAPIFIIGHWRTGTTLLHNLLSLDPRHASPNGYECAFPTHFVLTERWLLRFFDWLPEFRRPMDNMKVRFRSPQEDEFALLLLGEPTPYWHFAFPNRSKSDSAGELGPLPSHARESLKQALWRFVQQLTWLHSRRLVLKSPPHSARIGLLLELFPEARFVHIVRNPHEVIPSTLKMDRALLGLWAVQEITEAQLEQHVFERGAALYERLEAAKGLVSPNRFHELRYEDLVRDPIGELRNLYTNLELEEFEIVRPNLEEYLASITGYVPNRHSPEPRLRDEIIRRWGPIIERYGY